MTPGLHPPFAEIHKTKLKLKTSRYEPFEHVHIYRIALFPGVYASLLLFLLNLVKINYLSSIYFIYLLLLHTHHLPLRVN